MGMKTTMSTRFFKPRQKTVNKGKPNSKFRSLNNRNKNKNMTCAKQESNKILLQQRNKNRAFGCDKKMYPKLTFKK
jgi:hypothetical protein